MPTLPLIHILWDASHIWGLMAWRALRAIGLPCRLSKGREIAEGLLLRKPWADNRPPVLLVPGGNARLKARGLGTLGLEAVRRYVATGGAYVGFCGGAGLALTSADTDASLNLCPWSRKPYPDRLQHLASGHVRARASTHPLCPPHLQGQTLSLPVWWPGRFLADGEQGVEILARATSRDHDFWLGDLPLDSLPNGYGDICKAEYDLDLSSHFLKDMPLIITGSYGRGRYVLSYSHLETPNSPHANAWLAHLFASLTADQGLHPLVPSWNLDERPKTWPSTPLYTPLTEGLAITRGLLDLGLAHHLFFTRTSWLAGWRSGLPGAAINSLHAAFWSLLQLSPTPEAVAYWQEHRKAFAETLHLFAQGAEESLLTSRIASVLGSLLPHSVRHRDLVYRQEMIFGTPRDGGGLLGTLLTIVEELIYLSQRSAGYREEKRLEPHH